MAYIPVRLRGERDKIAAANKALEARDQLLLEAILNPWIYDVDLNKILRRAKRP
jgi:hypothetical protein